MHVMGVGVHFGSTISGKSVVFEGSKCEAAAHAIIMALEELMKHPENMDESREWTIKTPCQFIVDGIETGNKVDSECETCRDVGNMEDLARLRELLSRFPSSVVIDLQWLPNEKAHRLAVESIRKSQEYRNGDHE